MSQQAAVAMILARLGFQSVGRNNILARLNAIEPDGGTALRDSMLGGIGMILKLNQILGQLGAGQCWNFVHIVITDGQDTSSKATLRDTAQALYVVGQTIPVSRCKTIIIGIDLGEDAEATAQLCALRQIGGENCELYEINSVNISSLFNRIQVSLGIRRQTGVGLIQSSSGQRAMIVAQRNQPVMQVSRTSFAVIFNVDISGSMYGNRFERVKSSIAQFLANTPDDDLVACICFNEESQSLASC